MSISKVICPLRGSKFVFPRGPIPYMSYPYQEGQQHVPSRAFYFLLKRRSCYVMQYHKQHTRSTLKVARAEMDELGKPFTSCVKWYVLRSYSSSKTRGFGDPVSVM